MAMGIVTDQDFQKEMESLGLVIKDQSSEEIAEIVENVIDINRGRGEGRKEVPEAIRQLIADESLLGVPAKVISDSFGISQSSISAYKTGATSTNRIGSHPDESLTKHVLSTKQDIVNTAHSKILSALSFLDDNKVANSKARDIAGIAKDLSAVAKNLEGNTAIQVNNQQINVYRPRMKEEEDYNVIEVNE